jgi:5-methylcytosine-specific restriction endonuclease McrA
MDHILPVSRGGGLSADNILPVCKPCNSSKRDKYFGEWYPKQSFYSKEREVEILNYLKFMEANQNERGYI